MSQNFSLAIERNSVRCWFNNLGLYTFVKMTLFFTLRHYTFCDLTILRARLLGEFQPGLKSRSTHRAEILLWLHAQFQAGRKTQISVRKVPEMRKHSQCACSRSFFGYGLKFRFDYVRLFFRISGPFCRAENPSPVCAYRARIFSPGWIALWAEPLSM